MKDEPTSGQVTELRWVAQHGTAHSTAQLDSLVQHGWASRFTPWGRYGAQITPKGQAVLDAAPAPVQLTQPADPFENVPGGGW